MRTSCKYLKNEWLLGACYKHLFYINSLFCLSSYITGNSDDTGNIFAIDNSSAVVIIRV